MRLAARTQAAIEIIESVENDRRPADRFIYSYFRNRRYAGAKDRAAISGLVYEVLRRREELVWRLGSNISSRLRVLACLIVTENLSKRSIAELCNGEKYGPEKLSSCEENILFNTTIAKKIIPDWARANYPEWLDESFHAAFESHKIPEMLALNRRAPLDLRVNTLLTSVDEVARKLNEAKYEFSFGEWAPTCLRLHKHREISRHELFINGDIEIQDQGSQIVASLCDVKEGDQVVDYCAGAGGKTLALSAIMKGTGQIYAVDKEYQRVRRLKARLERSRVRNVQCITRSVKGNLRIRNLARRAQRVLVDVPCSGSGIWRRNPEDRGRLSSSLLGKYIDLQKMLLREAADLVCPGGRLIYCTCSIIPDENESQALAFSTEMDDFKILNAREIWKNTLGQVPDFVNQFAHLSPYKSDTDGFFVAVFERRTDINVKSFN